MGNSSAKQSKKEIWPNIIYWSRSKQAQYADVDFRDKFKNNLDFVSEQFSYLKQIPAERMAQMITKPSQVGNLAFTAKQRGSIFPHTLTATVRVWKSYHRDIIREMKKSRSSTHDVGG